MGTGPSTPRKASIVPEDTTEYLIATFVGDKAFPLTSEFWQNLLDVPLHHRWPPHRVLLACQSLVQNDYYTKHLLKLLIHFGCCLQDITSSSGDPSSLYTKALNAAYLSSVFLKYVIENSKTDDFKDFYFALDDNEVMLSGFPTDKSVENFVIESVLNFICNVEASPLTFRLHYELHNFMMVAMSTQLLSGPSPGPKDFHPFSEALMNQEASFVAMVVHRLLLNYISQPRNISGSALYSEGSQPGVLQKFGSAAASLVLFPLHLFVGSNDEASRILLARSSLHLLLIIVHFRKCLVADEPIIGNMDENATSDALLGKQTYLSVNPYCRALENTKDDEFDRVDIEGNAHSGPLVRVPFASLYDTLCMCVADEAAALLLYSLVNGNADFLEYVLVRTDLDTLLMPILEILYNAQKRTSNQIYMLLIILLILSQDSTFNASVHKLMLPNVPWYQERRLRHTSLGSLMVIILIRTVKYNLSRLQDVYLHTNCLAILANIAPHVHRLDAYASQRLVSLFHMLSRKYTKLAELQNDKMLVNKVNSMQGDSILEEVSMELHIYTDFLRIVLEIINAVLMYALPRNPEVVYAIMHRQEVFQPFRNHPRFNELLENLFTVLDFFNNRMDTPEVDGEWSVEKVLQVIINNCRSWRGDGMKMFTQLRFTYEQESHPEEFFIPYVWQLAVAGCDFAFNPSKINLFAVDGSLERNEGEVNVEHRNGDIGAHENELDPYRV